MKGKRSQRTVFIDGGSLTNNGSGNITAATVARSLDDSSEWASIKDLFSHYRVLRARWKWLSYVPGQGRGVVAVAAAFDQLQTTFTSLPDFQEDRARNKFENSKVAAQASKGITLQVENPDKEFSSTQTPRTEDQLEIRVYGTSGTASQPIGPRWVEMDIEVIG